MNGIAPERLPGLLGHELRNPLASAVTGVMLARDMVDDGDPRAAALDGVLRDLDRITELVDGWLQLARSQTPARRALPLGELLAPTLARHRAELICCPDDCAVEGHTALLERVFDNLCDNARQAGAQRIRIAVQHAGDDVAIHVEDDGKGVPAEHTTRVFEPGFSRRGGTGLGLAAVAATLAAHGGSVRCTPLRRGTRFTILLPRARTGAALR